MHSRIVRALITSGVVVVVVGCATSVPAATDPSLTAAPTNGATASQTAAPDPTPSLGATVGDGEAWIAAQGDGTIHLIRPDGSGDHVPFPLLLGGEQLHPDWSPDGQRLSLTTRGETDEIWIGNVDGTEARKVVDCQAPCLWADEAAWSPDGTSLVFQRMTSVDGADVSTLEILDVASGEIRVVLAAPTGRGFYQPRWAPDGKRVVTEVMQPDDPTAGIKFGVALAIVDVTAAKPVATEITDAADLTTSPDWSWVTDMIVFAQPNTPAGFDGSSDLATMRPDGTERSSILSVGARGGQTPQPAWSTDGTRIIFVQPDSSMATIGADGSDPAPAVATGRGRRLHPRYRPVP